MSSQCDTTSSVWVWLDLQDEVKTGKVLRQSRLLFDDPPLGRGTNPAMLSRKAGIGYGVHPYDLIRLRVRVKS